MLGILAGGYFYYTDNREAAEGRMFRHYASVIAETSVAAELYRNHEDSFLVARDSILARHAVSLDQMRVFKESLAGDEGKWAKFWDYVVEISDSLISYHELRLRAEADSLNDSTGTDQVTSD